MTQNQRQQAIAGVALVVLGLALYYLEDLGNSLVFFLVGGGFLVFYFYRKEFGLLIPGCIILGLGVGSAGHALFDDFNAALGLGIGFLAITVIALIYERRFVWWPLIPGSVLVLLNLPRGKQLIRVIRDHWQLGLVGVGILVLIGAFVRPGSRKASGSGD